MSTMSRPATPLTGPYTRPIRVPRNRIAQGDCAEVLRRLPDNAVDLVLTDPPYICRYQSRDGRTVANDDNDQWLLPAFEQVHRVLKEGGFAIYKRRSENRPR